MIKQRRESEEEGFFWKSHAKLFSSQQYQQQTLETPKHVIKKKTEASGRRPWRRSTRISLPWCEEKLQNAHITKAQKYRRKEK